MQLDKNSQVPELYYRHARKEILPLLPREARRVLDLGAGSGVTSRWLRTIYPAAKFVGAEGNPTVAEELRTNVDESHIGDINVINSYLGSYDLVLCLDILEHQVHPEIVLASIVDRLPIGATVIISLPNVAHFSVSFPLLFGNFEYREEGILDRTHLHFYTEKSALGLARGAGITPVSGVITGPDTWKGRFLDRVTCGIFQKQITFQYVFSSQKLSSDGHSRVRWKYKNTGS